ncbi:serine hydrolase domain-containing protein [Kitasatospora sp. NPDC059646]|uniref:serine hydrolase domain-containing protein n=1 Tax=Kitasatospora sp. NPDC059646 TaxID=3346893 RepID=UPI0036BB1230
MNSTVRNRRWATLAVAGAMLAAVVAGTGGSAVAATAPTAAVTATASGAALPPVDREAVRQVVAGFPNADINGVLVRVAGSGGLFEASGGVGDRTTGAAPDPEGRFRIGSISKVFTATVVLQLAAEHRLDVHGTVQQYLPGLLPADFPPIEVGQLLNHTSGLPHGSSGAWGDGTATWFAAHRFDSWTPEQIVATLAGEQMVFAPGTGQQYNGFNTFIAGLLIEKVTGHSYAHEVKHRIIQPLQLRDTAVPDRDDPRLANPAAHAYLTVPDADGTGRPVDVTEQSPWPWAEGGLISSAPDLDRFVTALFRGRLLPAAQQELLFTVPDVQNVDNPQCRPGQQHACMSMGLVSTELNGVTLWGKTGSRPGWTSGVFATRDLQRRMVYSFNPTGVQGADMRYVLQLADAVIPPRAQ